MTASNHLTRGRVAPLLVAVALIAGAPGAQAEGAYQHPRQMGEQKAAGGHGAGKMHAGKGRHGAGGKHLLGKPWRATLSDEQRLQLDNLHLAYAKIKAPLKARMKTLKVQFSVMAVSDELQLESVDAKINELLSTKRELLQAKFNYIAAQRRVLTPEQRVSFDLGVVRKAMHGKKGSGQHGKGKH